MVVEIVNPRIITLNSITPCKSNVLDMYFLLLFFNSQQIKLFWREYHEYIEITNLTSILQESVILFKKE
jgi:hypothetical protein